MSGSAGALAATLARDACDVVGQRNVHQIVARGRRDDAFVTLRLSKYDLHSSPTLLSVPRFTNRHISIVDSSGKADISRNPIDKSGKTRKEERRVGKESVSKCRLWGMPHNEKKKIKKKTPTK